MKKFQKKIILDRATSTKICRICKEEKAYEELATRGKYKDTDIYRTHTLCKKCSNILVRERRKKNITPEKKQKNSERVLKYTNNNKEKIKSRRLLKKYGVTLDWLYQKLIEQEFKCTICNIEINENSAVVDHCHDKNYIRGVICNKCNTAIGFFKNNTDSMKKAIQYLKERVDKSWF